MDWKEAISFAQVEQEKTEDEFLRLLWKRLQLGDRTQDLLQTLIAMKAMRDDTSSQSPEWQSAMKWLAWQRAQQSNLMLDMMWAQLESGNRTPELLALIRQAAQAPPPLPAVDTPAPNPVPAQTPEEPPSPSF